MGIIRKQGIITTIIAYIGIALGAILVLYFLPKNFSQEEVGIRNLIFEIAFLLSQLIDLGGKSTLIRFYPKFKDNIGFQNSLLLFCLALPLVALSVIGATSFFSFNISELLFYDNSQDILDYINFCVVIAILIAYSATFEFYSRLQNHYLIPKVTYEITLRVIAIILISLYGVDVITFNQFWVYITLSYITLLIVNVYTSHNLKPFSFTLKESFFSKKQLYPIINYSSFALLTSAASIITLKFDAIMVASMIGLKETAIYTIAVFIVTVIETPRKSLNTVLGPTLSSSFAQNDMNTIDSIYKKTSVNQLIIGGMIFCLIWLNIDYLFYLMPNGNQYELGKTIILILGIAKTIEMIGSCNTALISYSNQYRFNFISIIGLLIITVTTNLLLIPQYGINGAAIASLISLLCFNLTQYLFIRLKFKLTPFSIKLIFPTLILISLISISFYLPKTQNPFLGLLLNSILIIAVYLPFILFTNDAEDLKGLIRKIWSKIF